jgi:hypothetical protein
MDTSQEIKFIVDTFQTVKRIEQAKYRKGLSIRQTIINRLDKGETIDHYRMEFLKDSIFKVFKFIEDIGLEFNKEHPEDKFVAADIADILCNCVAILENKVQN